MQGYNKSLMEFDGKKGLFWTAFVESTHVRKCSNYKHIEIFIKNQSASWRSILRELFYDPKTSFFVKCFQKGF